ncbi:hypothetical protein ABPG73_007541, partial [Tetrahymena malaccensis]
MLSNNIISNETANHITKNLKVCKNLSSLKYGFQNKNTWEQILKNEGAEQKSFLEIKSLNLNFSFCRIGDQGVKAISLALEKCQKISSLEIDLSKEINIENNISQTNKNSFKDINLSDIQLLHKEQLKIVCINKNNLNDNQDLSGYQVAKLDFRGTLNVQNNCLCFGMGSNNVVSAIQKIQDVKNITSVILDLTNNVINIKKVQSIFASLVKCKNINSLEISINQDYYNQGDMKNILCFLQLCQEMPNFNLRLSGQENEVILKKQGNMINILLDHTQFKFDELLHKERFTNIKAALNNMPIQTQIKIKIENSKIDIEGAKQIASIIDNSKNTKYLSLHLSQEQISLRFFIFFNLNALSMYVQFRMITLVLNLKVLIYQYSNDFHMGYQGANYIIEKVQNCQHLNQLSLRL